MQRKGGWHKPAKASDDEKDFVRIVVLYYNDIGEVIHVKKIKDLARGDIPYPSKLEKQLVKKFGHVPRRNVGESGGAPGPNFWQKFIPPGEDKINMIKNRWIAKKEATWNMKEGIILKSWSDSEIIKKYRPEMEFLQDKIRNLSDFKKNAEKFGVDEFIKYQLLKKELYGLPLSTELKNQSKSLETMKIVVDFQRDFVEKKIVELEKIIKEQITLWRTQIAKSDFRKLLNISKNYLEYYHDSDMESDMKILVDRNKKSTKKK